MTDTSSPTAVDSQEPQPFATTLLAMSRGRTHDELSRQLRDLIRAVSETGKKGTLTFRLTVTPRNEHVVEVSDEVTVKAPTAERGASIFYVDVDDNHALRRSDPRQPIIHGLGG